MASADRYETVSRVKPYYEMDAQLAVRLDRCNLADEILEQIGNDHSTDADPLWEAEWFSDNLQLSFALQRDLYNDEDMYWLGVTSYGCSDSEWYGFTRRYASIDWVPSNETSDEEVTPAEDLVLWRQLVKELDGYLATSGIDKNNVEPDPFWNQVFGELILSVYADEIVTDHIKRVANGEAVDHETEVEEVMYYLQWKYPIDEEQAADILWRAEDWERWGYGQQA